MGWSFRKSKKIGPFRISLGKSGISTSFGVKGARIRSDSKGRIYGSIGAKGLRFQQRLNSGGRRRAVSQGAAGSAASCATGCLAVVGAGFTLLLCSGILLSSLTPDASHRATSVASSTANNEASRQPDGVESSVAATASGDRSASRAEASASESTSEQTNESAPKADDGAVAGGEPVKPAAIAVATQEASSDELLGPAVPTVISELQEAPRTWADSTGKYSTVATLIGMQPETVQLRNGEGRTNSVPLAKLSAKDAAYARLRTAPRVNAEADVMLGTVVSISDGDTIKIRTIDDETKTLRLGGIDAPESGQPFGTRAKQQLGDWVFQKEVRAEVLELDRYGRYIADVYVGDRWVNWAMVRAGLAWHYVEYSQDSDLAQAESLARAATAGIWSTKSHVAPWDWRRGDRASTESMAGVAADTASTDSAGLAGDQDATDRMVYVTNSGSKYHRAGCQHLAKSSRPIPYSQAKDRYDPCSRCKP